MTRIHGYIYKSVACILLAAAGVAVAATTLPPISDPATEQYHHGKFVWIDLVTADVSGAQKFYGDLFGWSFEEIDGGMGRYAMVYKAGVPVAGMAARQPAPGQVRQSRWIAYLSVADVDSAAARVTAQGGKVLIPARNLHGRGRMAVLADPDGAPFGLLNSSTGDPADFRAEPGEWMWAIYQSPDADSAAAFYQDVAGFDVVPDDDRLAGATSFTLQTDGFARASLVEIPEGRTELRPDWLYFVRVTDVAASAAEAVKLGGRVIVAPRPDLLEGRMAVIADPGGAPLGLLAWDAADDGEGN